MGFSQTIGQIAWMIVPWFWVIIANPDLFDTQAIGVRRLSIIVGAACMVLGMMPALFCKEIDQANLTNRDTLSFRSILGNFKSLLRNMVLIFKNIPFVRLCGATFLVFNGFQMVASFSYFIIVFYMFKGNYADAGTWPAWFSTVSALATALFDHPLITWMSNRWGKRNAFIISTAISIIGYILKWWGFNPPTPGCSSCPSPDGLWHRWTLHPDDEHDG
jgi:GPH family glycoside/pentoside/hexuronide:cation symporter